MVQSSTEAILKENYHATTYKGQAPTPLPKVQEELPWEKLAQQEKELTEEVEEKKVNAERRADELFEQGTLSGIVGKVGEVMTKISATVGQSLHKLTLEATNKLEEAQKTRVQERFPVKKDEHLMYEYSAYVFTEETSTSGWFYITTEHVGFFADCGDYRMKIWIPLDKIVSIQRGASLPRADNKGVFVQMVESEDVPTDAILIYTDEGEVHKFYNFHVLHDPISNYYVHAWNVLDHAWRDSTEELKEGRDALRKDPWVKQLQEEGTEKEFTKDPAKDFEGDMKEDFQDAYLAREEQRKRDAEFEHGDDSKKDKKSEQSKDKDTKKEKQSTEEFEKESQKDTSSSDKSSYSSYGSESATSTYPLFTTASETGTTSSNYSGSESTGSSDKTGTDFSTSSSTLGSASTMGAAAYGKDISSETGSTPKTSETSETSESGLGIVDINTISSSDSGTQDKTKY